MFDYLKENFANLAKTLSGKSILTEKNISVAAADVRDALLQADVGYDIVENVVEKISKKALGEKVRGNLSPYEVFVRVVRDELVSLMKSDDQSVNLASQPPAIILVFGLQGVGKTTTVAKIAHYLNISHKKKVGVMSCDVYRPSAIEQLKVLANTISVEFLNAPVSEPAPIELLKNGISNAKRRFLDVLIVDTAGRLSIDEDMMKELESIQKVAAPVESFYVLDSMVGQDAVKSALIFAQRISITGLVLTKADADSRGGAALSALEVTGAPIKFLGFGEKVDDLEEFQPDRLASRILGMGDLAALVDEVEKKVDKDKAEKFAKKIQKGKGFTLEDFREQLEQLNQLGGIEKVMTKLPGMSQQLASKIDKTKVEQFNQFTVIINSMTHQERHFPNIIKASRKKRISKGSGTSPQQLNRLLKQFSQSQKMMKKMKSESGVNKMMGLFGKS